MQRFLPFLAAVLALSWGHAWGADSLTAAVATAPAEKATAPAQADPDETAKSAETLGSASSEASPAESGPGPSVADPPTEGRAEAPICQGPAPAPAAAAQPAVSSAPASAALAVSPEIARGGEAASASETWIRSSFFPAVDAPPPSAASPVLTEADLASALRAEPLAGARKLFDSGRFDEVIAQLGGSSAPQARFVRAMALHRAGRAAEAGKAFAEVAPSYPPLADRCRFLAGTSFEAAGMPESAANAYRLVSPTATSYLESQRSLARVLQRVGDLRGALAVWRPLSERVTPPWGLDVAGEALFEIGQLEELLGHPKEAAAAFLRAWAEHPGAPGSAAALSRARSLGAQPTLDQTLSRAERLLDLNQSRSAAEMVRSFAEAPPTAASAEQVCLAKFVLGKAFRKMRQHTKAVAVLKTVLSQCEPSDTWARAAFVAGTSASYLDPEESIRAYLELAQRMPESPLADDALLAAAEQLQRKGRLVQARIALQRLTKLYPDGDQRSEALFRLFWLDRAEGRLPQALSALERLGHSLSPIDADALERSLYWRGRTLLDLQREAEARRAFEALAIDHPASYYALLARSRLAELAPPQAAAISARLATPAYASPELKLPLARLAADPRLASAIELLRLGFSAEAAEELAAIDRAPLRDSADSLRLIVALLGRTGDQRLAHAVARTELRRDLGAAPSAENALMWRLAYPLAFREIIERHAKDAGIDPDLVQALIREESALDPRVHSWAGAVGLCQLMVPTAREQAAMLKAGRVTIDRLHEPDFNVRLGTHYLARLVRQFKGNVALSLAAYNAGGGAVGSWIKALDGPRELDEFVEDIPVLETRNYVKRVLKSYAAYQLVYGRGGQEPGIERRLVATR